MSLTMCFELGGQACALISEVLNLWSDDLEQSGLAQKLIVGILKVGKLKSLNQLATDFVDLQLS